ncbi:MAG: hypothetical protein C4321_00180 [Chloroflexota bacterium]
MQGADHVSHPASIGPIPDGEPGLGCDLDDPALYLNRELSWLEFNQRVLAEASDPRNLLLERVKFLAITASNLDEFFAKRVGWLRRMLTTDARARTVDGLTIAEQYELVIDRCHRMRNEIEEVWRIELVPQLAAHGVRVVKFVDLEPEAQQRLREYFERSIFPVLTPLVVDPAHPFPFISGGSLSLALNVRHPVTGQDRFARVKVPPNRPRFVDAGDFRFVLLEDLIAAHVEMLFPGMEVTDCQELRVLRSAETGTPGEEADDLLELIESALRRRRLAEAVSVEVTGSLPPSRMELLLEELQVTEREVYRSDGPLGLHDLFQLASLELAELRDPPFTPAVPSAFAGTGDAAEFFTTLRERDLLVHHPYESFDETVVRFVEEASEDPAVLAIKATMFAPRTRQFSRRSSTRLGGASRSPFWWSSPHVSTRRTISSGHASSRRLAFMSPMVNPTSRSTRRSVWLSAKSQVA